jgi:hypothetical protein
MVDLERATAFGKAAADGNVAAKVACQTAARTGVDAVSKTAEVPADKKAPGAIAVRLALTGRNDSGATFASSGCRRWR